MDNEYDYKTILENEESDTAFVVLKKISQKNGKAKLFKFPVENIDTVISLLYNTKESLTVSTDIETPILDTMVSLFLSGISLEDLSTQYNYSKKRIRLNLEKKGLILFDS
ncbi:hypothetical protein ACSVH2_06730 [Flavobacterium sp. RSB2_4_14]|uniref:hypothetical protein n=1 Tax=Flavobacterium sp. RSB2_4_14 TaxID=3447665 RepID=UPI003F2C365E